jgi:hypothetical protein
MLERLTAYAGLREEGVRPADAAREVGLQSTSASQAYERWYRREHLGLADRPSHIPADLRHGSAHG